MAKDTCYILGAGASFGYNTDLPFEEWPPLTDGLVKRGVELDIIPHKDFSEFCHGLRRYAQARHSDDHIDLIDWEYDLERALRWLVKLFDNAADALFSSTPGSSRQDKCLRIVRWTRAALSQSFYYLYELLRRYTLNATLGSDAYTSLASHYNDRDYSVVTLNYDGIYESALNHAGVDYHYIPENAEPNNIPVAKLHGSINWISRGIVGSDPPITRDDFRKLTEPVYDTTFHTDEIETLSFSELEDTPYYRLVVPGPRIAEPGLMPPIGRKKTVDKIRRYEEVWEYAEHLIQDASEFVIIGCSLREDDGAFRELLSENARDQPGITVVKHSPDKITDDIEAIFQDPQFNDPYYSFSEYADDL